MRNYHHHTIISLQTHTQEHSFKINEIKHLKKGKANNHFGDFNISLTVTDRKQKPNAFPYSSNSVAKQFEKEGTMWKELHYLT